MAQPVNPPDGWSVTAGEWGVDFQRDTSGGLSSATRLHVVGPAANTQTLVGPWFPVDGAGVVYSATAVLLGTFGSGSSPLTLKLELYQSNQQTLVTTIYLYNNQGIPYTGNYVTASKDFTTWTNTKWARFVFTRNVGSAVDVYIDRLEVKKMAPSWTVFKTSGSGTQAFGAAPAAPVSMGGNGLFGQVSVQSSTSVTVFRSGMYFLHFRSYLTSLSAGTVVEVYFYANGGRVGGLHRVTANSAGVANVTHTALYHHAGTTGAGTAISVYLNSPNAGVVAAEAGGVTEDTAITAFQGVWVGLG